MSLACWNILSMSNHGPRSHVECSHWLGLSSPQAMRIHTPSLSMPSAENSTSSGVGASYLQTCLLFNVTCQPSRQASYPIPFHHIYSVLIPPLLVMALRNRCRVRLSFCKCNKLLLSSSYFFCLSASDAKERQHWVSRLQICTQHHTEAMGKVGWGVLNMFTRQIYSSAQPPLLMPSPLFFGADMLKSVRFNLDSIRLSKLQISNWLMYF